MSFSNQGELVKEMERRGVVYCQAGKAVSSANLSLDHQVSGGGQF
jgi:hypothetical protein